MKERISYHKKCIEFFRKMLTYDDLSDEEYKSAKAMFSFHQNCANGLMQELGQMRKEAARHREVVAGGKVKRHIYCLLVCGVKCLYLTRANKFPKGKEPAIVVCPNDSHLYEYRDKVY
jgi:hypothetical protein